MILTSLAKVGMGVSEYGVHFVTAQPVNLHWVCYREESERSELDLEPFGKYVAHDPIPNTAVFSKSMSRGITLLECPLVIPASPLFPESVSWKGMLADVFEARGLALTLLLLDRGFDSVVTVGLTQEGIPRDTHEIVLFHEVQLRP